MNYLKLTSAAKPVHRQSGFTLVELMVAMGLGLLVITIAGGALLLGRQGFEAVDSGTQMRDKQRLVIDLITRTIVQAGFEDFGSANATFRANADIKTLEPDLFGWNNALYTPKPGLNISETTTTTNGNRSSKCGSVTDTSCLNGSDILVVRYQGIDSPQDNKKADNSMINCGGSGEKGLTTNDLNERGASLFHVAAVNGEPSLYCTYYNHAKGEWADSSPLIEGVESFQLLYGTDGVVPNTVPVVTSGTQDSIAERWLRADQLTVAGNAQATRDNWRRVRAIRVGMVLRGPVGSAQQAVASTFRPLGESYTDKTNDTGAELTVAKDGRLRTTSSFTVHVRNDLTTR